MSRHDDDLDLGFGVRPVREWPRRADMQRWVEAEHKIHDAIQAVEMLGAHVTLTNAVIKLGEAKAFVADFVDGLTPMTRALEQAIHMANMSPCQSKRGAVVFNDEGLISSGYNDQVPPRKCDGSNLCKSTCRISAVHAEQFALMFAGVDAKGADILHVKTVDGKLVPSGPPSCVECSKLIVGACIKNVWLFHEDGWKRYTAEEFHFKSLSKSS